MQPLMFRRGPKPQPCTEGVEIGPLVFRCPTVGHNIESGIEMDLQTFRRVGHLSVRLRCRDCGRPHELKVADAASHPIECRHASAIYTALTFPPRSIRCTNLSSGLGSGFGWKCHSTGGVEFRVESLRSVGLT